MPLNTTQNATILLYHGVTSGVYNGLQNYSGKHVHKCVFEEQISTVASTCKPVSFKTLVEILKSGEDLSPKTVAVTFDDCFENVFACACPILKKYNIPATMFVTTGFVNTNRIIWADLLEIIIGNCRHDEFVFDDLENPKKYPLRTYAEKKHAVREIKSHLKSISEEKKDKIMSNLIKDIDINLLMSETDLYKNLTWAQVKNIDWDPLFEIGSHTINHRVLSLMPADEAEKEIVGSKHVLEKELGHAIDLFSYPEGQEDHYNDAIIEILKNNGFRSSPSAIYGTNAPGEDPFHLKRIMVGFNGIPFPFE